MIQIDKLVIKPIRHGIFSTMNFIGMEVGHIPSFSLFSPILNTRLSSATDMKLCRKR